MIPTWGKIAAGIAAVFIIIGATAAIMSSRADGKIHDAELKIAAAQQAEKTALQAQAKAEQRAADKAAEGEQWKTMANQTIARVMSLEGKITVLEKRIKDLGPVAPPTDLGTVPEAAAPLAEAFKKEGMPPIDPPIPGAPLGFTLEVARPLFAFMHDGKLYPQLVALAGLQKEEIGVLTGQKEELFRAVDQKAKEADANKAAYQQEVAAVSACNEAGAAKDTIIDEQKVIIGAQASKITAGNMKKYLWGGSGLGLGALLMKLVLLL
jgi:hypothetical protein